MTLPTYTAEIVTKMQQGADTSSILATGWIMLGYAAVSVAATIIETILSANISTRLGKRLRGEVFSHVVAFSDRDAGSFSAGSLLTRTINDVQQVVSAMVLGLRLGGRGAAYGGDGNYPHCAVERRTDDCHRCRSVYFTCRHYGNFNGRFASVQIDTEAHRRLNGVTRDTLSGIRVVRAYNAEAYQRERFEDVNEKFAKNNLFTGRVTAIMNPLMQLIYNGLTLAIYWLGCFIIVRDNNAAFFPTMFSFTQLASQVVTAFMVLVMLFNLLL